MRTELRMYCRSRSRHFCEIDPSIFVQEYSIHFSFLTRIDNCLAHSFALSIYSSHIYKTLGNSSFGFVVKLLTEIRGQPKRRETWEVPSTRQKKTAPPWSGKAPGMIAALDARGGFPRRERQRGQVRACGVRHPSAGHCEEVHDAFPV